MNELVAWARDVVASLDQAGRPTGDGRRAAPPPSVEDASSLNVDMVACDLATILGRGRRAYEDPTSVR